MLRVYTVDIGAPEGGLLVDRRLRLLEGFQTSSSESLSGDWVFAPPFHIERGARPGFLDKLLDLPFLRGDFGEYDKTWLLLECSCLALKEIKVWLRLLRLYTIVNWTGFLLKNG